MRVGRTATAWALAWAVGEARRRGARLLLAHVFRPPVAPATAAYGEAGLGMPRDPYGDSGHYPPRGPA